MKMCLMRKDSNFEQDSSLSLDHGIQLHSKLAARCIVRGKKTQVYLYGNAGSTSGMLCRYYGLDDCTAANRSW